MPDDYIEDFFECIYNAELEQKQQLDSADSFLVGILAGLIGVGVYYLQLMATSEFGWRRAFCGCSAYRISLHSAAAWCA
jgi:hypothetical protein